MVRLARSDGQFNDYRSLLGGYTDRMRVSHMLGFDEPAAMVAEASRMRDTYGITTFKVKVGRRPVTLDTAVVRAHKEHGGVATPIPVPVPPSPVELHTEDDEDRPDAQRAAFDPSPPRPDPG